MRILALSIIPAFMLSGCGMLPKAEEPVAYQAPIAVAKAPPAAKRATAPNKQVVRKPIVQPTPTSDRSGSDGGGPDSW